MLVPLTPEERLDLNGLLSSWGASAPASIAEIEWNRAAKGHARRLANAMRAWRAHRASHPAYGAHPRHA